MWGRFRAPLFSTAIQKVDSLQLEIFCAIAVMSYAIAVALLWSLSYLYSQPIESTGAKSDPYKIQKTDRTP